MKKQIIKFGIYSAAVLILLNIVSFAILGTESENFGIGEIIGYSIIIISLAFIFLGIREYRDSLDRPMTFSEALRVGLGIALIPSLVFGIYNVIYMNWIDPQFLDNYYEYQLQLNPDLDEEGKKALRAEMDMYGQDWISFFVMAVTVFIIGFIVTVVSSLVLRKR